MAKGDFWFKMQWEDWLGDTQLQMCSLETQGFWMKCICLMYKSESSEISGPVEKVRRLLGCTPQELIKCATELKETEAADVSIGNHDVTIISRRRQRELKGKEKNRLKVRKHRDDAKCNHDVTDLLPKSEVAGKSSPFNAECNRNVTALLPSNESTVSDNKHRDLTPDSPQAMSECNRDVTEQSLEYRVKSKSLNPNLESREESSSVVAAPPFSEPKPEASPQHPESDLRKPENPISSSSHPAVVVYEEIFGPVKPNFAKAITLGVSNLSVWHSLILEKASYPNPEKWIIGEYQKRVANAPPESRPHEPKREKTARDFAREAIAQMNEAEPQPEN